MSLRTFRPEFQSPISGSNIPILHHFIIPEFRKSLNRTSTVVETLRARYETFFWPVRFPVRFDFSCEHRLGGGADRNLQRLAALSGSGTQRRSQNVPRK